MSHVTWSTFRTIHNIASHRAGLNQKLAGILGLTTGSYQPRSYGPREDRRWHTWRLLRPDHERENGTLITRRILDLAGAHPTGWIVATCGRAWWQPNEPNPLDHIGQGVYILNLNTLGCETSSYESG